MSAKGTLKHMAHLLILMSMTISMLNASASAMPPGPGFGFNPGRQSQTNITGYNIIIMIDTSASVTLTDQDHMVADAAGIFLDSLYMREGLDNLGMPDSQVGVIAFNAESTVIQSLVAVTTNENAKYIKDKIKRIEYSLVDNNKNVGLAILSAVNEFNKVTDHSRKNMIILFTDGEGIPAANIGFPPPYGGVNGANPASILPGGSMEPNSGPPPMMGIDSISQQLEQAKQSARESSCEIYVVGLNFNNSISEESKSQLRSIANFTQTEEGIATPDTGDISSFALVNYTIVDDYGKIRKFLVDLFASMARTGGVKNPPMDIDGGRGYYNINVDSFGVAWVKIFMYSNSEVPDKLIDLRNPHGEKISVPDTTTWIRRGSGYTILTIERPDPGKWQIATSGNVGFEASYVLMGSIDLNLSVQQIHGAAGRVLVTGSHNGEPLDESFYKQLTLKSCTVTSADNNFMPPPPPPMAGEAGFNMGANWQNAMNAQPPNMGGQPGMPPSPISFDLVYKSGDNALVGEFSVNNPGRYTVQAVLGTEQMEHTETETVEFRLENTPLNIRVKKGETRTFTVANEIGWNNLMLIVNSVQPYPSGQASDEETTAQAEIERALNNNSNQYTDISVTGVQDGSDLPLTLIVAYNNMSGAPMMQSATIEGVVSVGKGGPIPIPVFEIGTVPLIVLLAILMMIAAFLIWRQTERVYGIFDLTIECGGTKIQQKSSGPRGHSFTLYKLLISILSNASDSESVLETVRQLQKELSKGEHMIYIDKNDFGVKSYFYGEKHESLDVIRTIHLDPRGFNISISISFILQ